MADVIEAVDPTDIRNAPPPPYVVTDADRERWDLSGKVAEAIWNDNAPGERLDPVFYWHMQRTVYKSDIPTSATGDRIPESDTDGELQPPALEPLPRGW